MSPLYSQAVCIVQWEATCAGAVLLARAVVPLHATPPVRAEDDAFSCAVGLCDLYSNMLSSFILSSS